jgi:hypothetical protein
MSLLVHADLLKAHLSTVTGLEGVAVHVDRKFDIRELAVAELGKKSAGAFVSISLGGWTPLNEDGGPGEYWATLRYEISIATMPHLLEALEMPEFDTILRRLVVAIQGWRPPGAKAAYCPEMRWAVGPGSYVPDDDFLVYLFPATVGEDFADPTPEP